MCDTPKFILNNNNGIYVQCTIHIITKQMKLLMRGKLERY